MNFPRSFESDLTASEIESLDPAWEAFYRYAFSGAGVVRLQIVDGHERQGLELQRRGVDRIVTIRTRKKIFVDEKYRSRWFGDMLIERWSQVYESGYKVPGWAYKPNALTHYIAYLVKPLGRWYLFRYDRLREALPEIEARGYPLVSARNPNCRTVSYAVPMIDFLDLVETRVFQQDESGRVRRLT